MKPKFNLSNYHHLPALTAEEMTFFKKYDRQTGKKFFSFLPLYERVSMALHWMVLAKIVPNEVYDIKVMDIGSAYEHYLKSCEYYPPNKTTSPQLNEFFVQEGYKPKSK
ncbi:MAG: hypothetical protein WC610_03040 [Patescibacteria group bacterium]